MSQSMVESLKRRMEQLVNAEIEKLTPKKPKNQITCPFVVDNRKTHETRIEAITRRLSDTKNLYQIMATIYKIGNETKEDLMEKELDLLKNLNLTPFPKSLKACKFFNISPNGCKNQAASHNERLKPESIVTHFCMLCRVVLNVASYHPAINCELLQILDKKDLESPPKPPSPKKSYKNRPLLSDISEGEDEEDLQ